MEAINISRTTFKKMKQYFLNDIINTEGNFYFINSKDKWETKQKLLKILFNNEGEIFSNKLFTINELIDNKKLINISELVMPEKLAIINEMIVGFTMPFIDNINFNVILKDASISNKQKLEYFKQIGLILDEMKKVRENTKLSDFYLNDIHEANFILNLDTQKINVVDMDSCKINGNKPFVAKYLNPFSQINNFPNKYKKDSGNIVATQNTDLYCYIVMILNFLYKGNITELSISEFYLYLDYLRTLGTSYELLDKFSKIYGYTDNQNVAEYLDLINDDIIHKSRKSVFQKKL